MTIESESREACCATCAVVQLCWTVELLIVDCWLVVLLNTWVMMLCTYVNSVWMLCDLCLLRLNCFLQITGVILLNTQYSKLWLNCLDKIYKRKANAQGMDRMVVCISTVCPCPEIWGGMAVPFGTARPCQFPRTRSVLIGPVWSSVRPFPWFRSSVQAGPVWS